MDTMRRLLRILDAAPPNGHTLLYVSSNGPRLYLSCKHPGGVPVYVEVGLPALLDAADKYFITNFGIVPNDQALIGVAAVQAAVMSTEPE